MEMSIREQKRDLRSLFLSSIKFCQPLVALQAASMSSVRAAYAAGGNGGSGAVLEDGGSGLLSFVWSDPKVRIPNHVVSDGFNDINLYKDCIQRGKSLLRYLKKT